MDVGNSGIIKANEDKMRSPKSRSRGKSNRNRSSGNNLNRVFDSSGPEGKVRGTPQQIIDKYQQLTSDAQLSNDRVAAENFQQHAEHYARLLGDSQREAEARKAEQEAQQRERQAQRDADRAAHQQEIQDAKPSPVVSEDSQPDVMHVDAPAANESGLVETPESTPKPKRARKPRAPKQADTGQEAVGSESFPDAPEAAE